MKTCTCQACGSSFSYEKVGPGRLRRFCSEACKARWEREVWSPGVNQRYREKRQAAGLRWTDGKSPISHTCQRCEKAFESFQFVKKFCGDECRWADFADRHGRPQEHHLLRKQDEYHRRRAWKRGGSAEKVDLLAILERDGWTCHLCGGLAPKDLRGKRHPLAPVVDHVIPLAKGGAHKAENLRCAHSKCNGVKGDRLIAA